MKSYMEHLDPNSSEHEYTRYVHDELTLIAQRCEDRLATSPVQLNRLKLRIDSELECFENQQLIWHGSLKKQSPRKRMNIVQQYLILFSDCILVCTESGNKFEMKRQLSIKNINVDVDDNEGSISIAGHLITGQSLNSIRYYPFRVNAIEKSYEFLAGKRSDREKWVNKIRQASEDFKRRNPSVESKSYIYLIFLSIGTEKSLSYQQKPNIF